MTVHDRAKLTGIVAGPNHPRVRQMMAKQAPPVNTENGRTGYRDAEDPARSCGTCSAFREGMCEKYSLPCEASKVCDGFMGGGEAMEAGEEDPGDHEYR